MRKEEGRSFLFTVTLAYFALSFVHVVLAATALVCMGLPFILAYRDRKKTWCRSVCPRADLLRIVGGVSRRKTAPQWMVGRKARRAVLGFFCMNLLFISMSTVAVANGNLEPIERIRLLIAFELPWSLPQLVSIPYIPEWVSHLSYRFYSIMMTSTLVGLALALRYKPRTWCAVCPVSTMTGNMISKMADRDEQRRGIDSKAS